MPEFIRIRNFAKYQHYKDRHPIWIKLYRELWGDPQFFTLTETERYFLISFFIVASQNDNRIPNDQAWLKREMATSKRIPIERLIDTSWLELISESASAVPSIPLAQSAKVASVTGGVVLAKTNSEPANLLALARSREKRREEKNREEKKPPNPLSGGFERVWVDYPNPVGKKDAVRHFNASVKTEKDLTDITTALRNYKQVRESENRNRRDPIRWQNGSTWFNNWQDWITIKPNGNGHKPQLEFRAEPEAKHTEHTCPLCDPPHSWQCLSPDDCDMSVELGCPEILQKLKDLTKVKT